MTGARAKLDADQDCSELSPREDRVLDIPESWAPESHVLRAPWIPSVVVSGVAASIADLEQAAPNGLDGLRRRFRDAGRGDMAVASTQILEARFELLVATQLARAGALTRIRSDTPDFDCSWHGSDFGVEATTRAREEVGTALERVMEQAAWDEADVQVTLTRTGKLLFSESPAVIAAASDQVVTLITAEVAGAANGEIRHGTVALPELGLNAMWASGTGMGMPGIRVTFQSPLLFTSEEWEYHWNMAAYQVKDTVEGKGRKNYDAPSIVVVDISRLGETSRLLTADGLARYQRIIDDCDLGNLSGALLVRTTLTSQFIEPLCYRADDAVRSAILPLIFGEIARTGFTAQSEG